MKVYVVEVESLLNGQTKVSQEGYKTLQAAQAFCMGRGDKPKKLNNFRYASNDTIYRIYEVNIIG